jgi:ketosteroid isomerase-like protein
MSGGTCVMFADTSVVRSGIDTGGNAMPPFVAAYYDAYLSRDPDRIAAVLHDQVEWSVTGPSDQFDLFGPRRGKEEVIEAMVRIIPCFFRISSFEFEHVLVQGDRVATYGQVRAHQRDTGRAIRFRFTHFMRFIDGKLIVLRAITDTFDAAEQLVGHPIDVSREMQSAPLVPEDDFSLL